VPGVLGAVLGHAALAGEFRSVWDFSEAPEEGEPAQEGGAASKDGSAGGAAAEGAAGQVAGPSDSKKTQ
jgi:hypothetical protein